MKSKAHSLLFHTLVAGAALFAFSPLHAATYYFDVNSTTAGSGVADAVVYNWSGANWALDNTGTSATATRTWSWETPHNAVFVSTADAGSANYTVNFMGGNNWVNSLTVNSGNLTINEASNSNMVLGSSTTWTVASGTSLTMNPSTNGWGVLNMNGNTLTMDVAGTATIAGMGNGGKLIKTGAGLLKMEGIASQTSYYSGGTDINNGTLQIGRADALGTTGTISFGGGTLQFATGITTDLSNRFSTAASQAYKINTNGNDVILATALTSSSGTLNKDGAGTLTLSVNNTYSGLTTVAGGALNISSSGSLKSSNALNLGASGTADFANTSQTLGAVDNANTTANALNFSASMGTVTLGTLTGAGSTRFGSNGSVTGGIAIGTVNAVGLLTASISGGTVGAGSLSATAVSGGTNTITGAAGITTLSNGTTTVGGVATIATMSGGIVNLNGATSAITTLNGGTVNLGSSTVLTVNGGTTSGSITGSGSLIKTGAGTLTLTKSKAYSGATTIEGGVLELQTGFYANPVVSGIFNVGSGAMLRVAGTTDAYRFNNVTVNFQSAGGGTLRGSSNTVTGLNWYLTSSMAINTSGGARNVFDASGVGQNLNLNGQNLTFDVVRGTDASSDLEVSAVLWNGGSITKQGDGILTLSGANTYSGATNVDSGKLVINGSISTSTTTVKTTGTLGGSGTVGAVFVQAGGTLAPGNSPGNITGTSLSLADNANFDIEIDKSLTPKNDSVTLTGNFSNVLAITTGANLNLSLTGTFVLGDRFTLADYNTINGTWNGGLFNLGAGTSTLADDSVFQYGSYDWRINYDDTTNLFTNSTESYTDGGKYLTLTVVPEPGAALLGGLGMLALLRRRR